MPYNRDEIGFHGTVLRGIGALAEALNHIGAHGEHDTETDKNLAKLIVDNELPLRALITYALDEMRETL